MRVELLLPGHKVYAQTSVNSTTTRSIAAASRDRGHFATAIRQGMLRIPRTFATLMLHFPDRSLASEPRVPFLGAEKRTNGYPDRTSGTRLQ